MKPTEQRDPRKRLYTLLRVANNEMARRVPGWDDDDYRQVLARHGARFRNGRVSATTMSIAQLEQALEYFKRAGFRVRRAGGGNSGWRGARIAKLNALWCALADAGQVEDRSEKAMQRWCAHWVPGLTRLQWSTSGQLNTAVEMLKQFCLRCGVDIKEG